MICVVCRNDGSSDKLISLQLTRDEMNLTVNQVPVHVCNSCGEGYLDEDVAIRLLQAAEAIFLQGTLENVHDYMELIFQISAEDH